MKKSWPGLVPHLCKNVLNNYALLKDTKSICQIYSIIFHPIATQTVIKAQTRLPVLINYQTFAPSRNQALATPQFAKNCTADPIIISQNYLDGIAPDQQAPAQRISWLHRCNNVQVAISCMINTADISPDQLWAAPAVIVASSRRRVALAQRCSEIIRATCALILASRLAHDSSLSAI